MSDLTIHRYDVEIADRVEVEMPEGAVIIHAAASDRTYAPGVALWATVDKDAPVRPRVIYVRGTGHLLGEAGSARHVGSVRTSLGRSQALIWHVFDAGVPDWAEKSEK